MRGLASLAVLTLPLGAAAIQLDPLGGRLSHGRKHNRRSRTPASPALSVRDGDDETAPFAWSYQGCVQDGNKGALNGYTFQAAYMTVPMCISTCANKNFTYAGVELGYQCHCGNSYENGLGTPLPGLACSSTCGGDGRVGQCGGPSALSVFKGQDAAVAASSAAAEASSSIASAQSAASAAAAAATATGTNSASPFVTATLTISGSVTVVPISTTVISGSTTIVPVTTTTAASARVSGTAAPVSATAPSAATTGPATTPASPSPAPSQGTGSTSYTPNNYIAGSNGEKHVWAHHIVGNTYSYSQNDWASDIGMAQGANIDGFFLNVGSSSWQTSKVADAYAAAQNAGFKMALSFDATEFDCTDASNIWMVQYYLDQFLSHPAAATYNGKSIVTTFAGESCTFGQSSVNAGWSTVFGSRRSSVYFMPAYNAAPESLGGFDIDAEVNWGSAWPSGSSNIDTSRDQYFISQLGGKGYVGTVSPLFYTHLSYKNWLWRSDDWLFAQRWEQLLGMRNAINQVQVISWNDYGEGHYIGNLNGAMPAGASAFANPNFPHTDVLSLTAFYAQAWKTGAWPTITKDQAWVMARPHPTWASAWGDDLAAPDGRSRSNDNFYAQVHLVDSASVTLCAGSSCTTQQGQPGINRFSQALVPGSGMSVTVQRNGQTTVNLAPSFTFSGDPQMYNFNYLIKSS